MSKSKSQKQSRKKGVRQLNARDRQIIEDLSWKIRYYTDAQITEYFFAGCRQAARRRIQTLIESGLLRATSVVCQEPPAILLPLYSSSTDYDEPDFDDLVTTLNIRFKSRRIVSQWVISTSTWADKAVAGRSRSRIGPHQHVGHDLGVSEVLLYFKQQRPDCYRNWTGEDSALEVPRIDIVPDAVTFEGRSSPPHVIEFGGDYHRDRLIKLHETCLEEGFTYELF